MTKILKQQLFSPFLPAFLTILVAASCYGFTANPHFLIISIFIACVITAAAAIFLVLTKDNEEKSLSIKAQDLSEKINTLREDIRLGKLKAGADHLKLRKYNSLKILLDKLNKDLSLDDTVETLIEEIFGLIGKEEETCIFYLFDQSSHALSILSSRQPALSEPIKSKQGDLFDQWVLRQAAPLLVEDTNSDFRFYSDKIKGAKERTVGSLIASALLSQQRVIGIIRIDSPRKKAFSLEDLRILSALADIASVAIDNALYYQRTKELAIKDTLTGLYLHNYIIERLDEELKRGLLTNRPLAVLMIDIDHFKNYNDQYGHLAGDIVLKSLSSWIKEYMGDIGAIIGRFGGEEFLVVLPFLDKKEAFSLAENMRGAIQERTITLRRKASNITVSIGVAAFPVDSLEPRVLLEKADSALYQAKHMGRNRVCLA